ncbi:MAG TPA: hypothetical protein VF219_22575 [Vicinamibacterales bacterium]
MKALDTRSTRVATVMTLGLLASYAYFYQAGGWNQNSRFALVRAILERHTLRIDAYQLHTGDKAIWRDHYYSDKPPGTSLMVVPTVAVARAISRAAGVDPESFPGIAWTSYVAAVTSAGVFTGLAALVVFLLTRQWGFSVGAALFSATAYGLSGPAWSYATLFMSHGVTAGSLMVAYAATFTLPDAVGRRRTLLAFLAGLGCGLAVLSEFQAAVPVLIMTALVLMHALRSEGIRRTVLAFAVPAVACAAVLFVYNTLAFDSPLHLGYASEEGFEHLRSGLFGITYPQWWRLRELLVGEYRGLLPLSPLLLAAPIGLFMLARDPRRRTAALFALFIGAYYFLLNASYFYWEGGWSYAPRQVTPALPFMALGLPPLWAAGRRSARAVLTAGWLWGVAITLVAVSTSPQPPSSYRAPMRELLWPAFRDGDLSLNHQTMVHGSASPDQMRGHQIPHAAWNLGELMGLQGLVSLLPLAIVWLAALLLIFVL